MRLQIVSDEVVRETIDDVGVVQIVVTLKLRLHSSQIADSTMAQTARPVAIYAREYKLGLVPRKTTRRPIKTESVALQRCAYALEANSRQVVKKPRRDS